MHWLLVLNHKLTFTKDILVNIIQILKVKIINFGFNKFSNQKCPLNFEFHRNFGEIMAWNSKFIWQIWTEKLLNTEFFTFTKDFFLCWLWVSDRSQFFSSFTFWPKIVRIYWGKISLFLWMTFWNTYLVSIVVHVGHSCSKTNNQYYGISLPMVGKLVKRIWLRLI